jgi:hypothetical protein
MASSVHVKGLDEVLANLNREIASIKGDVQKGLSLGMLMIKADSMKGTPVDVGNLRGSHYLVTGDGKSEDVKGKFKTPKKGSSKSAEKVASDHPKHVAESQAKARTQGVPFAEIGCTAFYAVYVHENPARHTVGHAKFLEVAIREGASKLLDTIKRFAKR